MKTIFCLLALLSIACQNQTAVTASPGEGTTTNAAGKTQQWAGEFTNGMKETTLTFEVSADGKEIKELTFNGYWRCSGRLTKDILGPTESFVLKNGVVDGTIIDKTAGIYYQFKGKISGNTASGTFRMAITGLGCDTYLLNWKAKRKS